MGLIFIDRIKTFLADSQKKKLVLLIFVLAIIPLTVIAALTIQNLSQKANESDVVRIADTNGSTLTQTTSPDVFIELNLPPNWVLPSKPSASNNLIRNAYALDSVTLYSQCLQDCSANGGSNCSQSCASLLTPTPTSISAACSKNSDCTNPPVCQTTTNAVCLNAGKENAKCSYQDTFTGTNCILNGQKGECSSSGTCIINVTPTISNCPPKGTIINSYCSSPIVAITVMAGGNCGEINLVPYDCSKVYPGGNGVCSQTGSTAFCTQSTPTSIPTSTPTQSSTNQPSPAPVPKILRYVYIENKDTDGSTGGSTPLKITVNSGTDIAHIPWKLNDLLSDQSQSTKTVQITLFSDSETLALISAVVLTRPPGLTLTPTPILSIISPTLSPTPTIPLIPSCGGQCGYTACKSYEKCSGAESEFGSPACKISITCGATCNDVIAKFPTLVKIKEQPCNIYASCAEYLTDDFDTLFTCSSSQYLCAGDCSERTQTPLVQPTLSSIISSRSFTSNVFPKDGHIGTKFTITAKTDSGLDYIYAYMNSPHGGYDNVLLSDDGLHNDGIANDGIYGYVFDSSRASLVGTYTLNFLIYEGGIKEKVEATDSFVVQDFLGDDTCVPVIKNGDVDKKIDLVFVTNHYDKGELSDFKKETLSSYIDKLFSEDPFSLNKDKFNIWLLQKVNNIDCSYNLAGSCFRDIIDIASHVCSFYDKIIVVDQKKAVSYAEVGGTISFLSGQPLRLAVGPFSIPLKTRGPLATLLHEFGHSMGVLDDEYHLTAALDYERLSSVPNCDNFGCPKWCSGFSNLQKPLCANFYTKDQCQKQQYNEIKCLWIENTCQYPYDSNAEHNFGESCIQDTACYYGCGVTGGYRSSKDSIMNMGNGEYNIPSKIQIQKAIDSYSK